VSENEFPWQVLLTHPKEESFCGGSLITSDTVLTAAHCDTRDRQKELPWITLGEHDRSKIAGHELRIQVAEWINHPDYNRFIIMVNDFAILKLKVPVYFNENVGTICLPTSGENDENREAIVKGWGNTAYNGKSSEVLKMARVRTMSNEECTSNGSVYEKQAITPEMLCASGEGTDSCQNDSGGPLVTKIDNHFELIGVASHGTGCANPNAPGVYARVSSALTWIKSHMSGHVCLPPK